MTNAQPYEDGTAAHAARRASGSVRTADRRGRES